MVLERTTSGGVSINETILHYEKSGIPSGGVGASGIGAYHGHEGFKMRRVCSSRLHSTKSRMASPPINHHFASDLCGIADWLGFGSHDLMVSFA
jgi:hypothetical protein